MKKSRILFNTALLLLTLPAAAAYSPYALEERTTDKAFINSIGLRMQAVPAGRFIMGSTLPILEHWDEWPMREVTISRPFFISETEITVEQYRQFDPDYRLDGRFGDFASGISWYDAMAFCSWLSEREGKPYRLPTEAEWEYVCRAGTTTLFASGESSPNHGWANAWGIKNMHTGVREWCYDWYGDYPEGPQTDPIGLDSGTSRVVRGGALDKDGAYYGRTVFNASSNRAGIAPAFGVPKTKSATSGSSLNDDLDNPDFQQGLIGLWYGGSDLTRPQGLMAISTLNEASIFKQERGRDWSAQWRGYLKAPSSAEVTFSMKVDTGGILRIDGQEVIRHWNSAGTAAGTFTMLAGKLYPIEISYRRDSLNPSFMLLWSWPDQPAVAIPETALFHRSRDVRIAEAQAGAMPGNHWIGFRVVQGPMPDSQPLATKGADDRNTDTHQACLANAGLDRKQPYFRKRELLPRTLAEDQTKEAIYAAGFHPSFRPHNHSPALAVCPNGDVLMITYSASHREYEPEVGLIVTRLRLGAQEWDIPDRMPAFVTANNHAPLLFTDGDKMHLFWGSPRLEGAFPFQWRSSGDNGVSWGEVQFPLFSNAVGPHSRQPINSAFRDKNGTLYVASDGAGPTSLLWASRNDGRTWFDTNGRTGGRHTTFALLSDGVTILGLGGKDSNIDGYMPQSVSSDGGKTWTISKTPFPAQGGNQRPSLLRLQSGRLFFAGDFQDIRGRKPASIEFNGSYVALSEDDGKTWAIKSLPGAQPHWRPEAMGGHPTLGYSAAAQGPDGMIHLITTLNIPCLHFEFNEAWILSHSDASIQ
jgi:hypothetical protein